MNSYLISANDNNNIISAKISISAFVQAGMIFYNFMLDDDPLAG